MENLNRLYKQKQKQKGLTLIELLVVIVIVGIILVIIMSSIGGGTNSANAAAIRSAATETARGVGFMNVNLGTGIETSTTNPLTASGEDMMDVLVKGRTAVATAYQPAYDQLNMRPMQGKINVDGSGFRLLGYGMSFVSGASCTANKVCTQFTNVPVQVVQELALKENMTYSAAANTSGENLRWTVAAGGYHTVTMLVFP